MGDSAEPFTEQEAEAFAHKLRSWGESLPDREQQLLSGIVESAAQASSDDDTAGYFFAGLGMAVAIRNAYMEPTLPIVREKVRELQTKSPSR